MEDETSLLVPEGLRINACAAAHKRRYVFLLYDPAHGKAFRAMRGEIRDVIAVLSSMRDDPRRGPED